MYPKGSSLGCLKRLSLGTGIFHVLASIETIFATLICCLMTVACFAFQDVMTSSIVALFPALLSGGASPTLDMPYGSELLSMGIPDVMQNAVFSMLESFMLYIGIGFGVVSVIMLLFSVLAVRRATTHLGRNRMLKLFPSDSGLRVYNYQLWPTILALLFVIAIVVCLFLATGFVIAESTTSIVGIFAVPVVAVVLDLATWVYMSKNFDKMMKEV